MELSNKFSANKIQIGHVSRWIGWAAIWLSQHPEIYTMNDWKNSPMLVVGSIAQYIFAGVLLEVFYRKLMWGSVKPLKPFITAIAPDCPENPWISLMREIPPRNRKIEVFCADGVARAARLKPIENNKLLFDIEFDEYSRRIFQESPWKIRPTHWRFDREDLSDVF